MKLVVDASVAVKLVLPEEGQEQAFGLLRQEAERLAPDLLLAEAANTFWKKVGRGELTAFQSRAGLGLIRDAIGKFIPDAELAQEALDLAIEIEHPVYDCLYLALAVRESATLVTNDTKLLRKTASTRIAQAVRPLAAQN